MQRAYSFFKRHRNAVSLGGLLFVSADTMHNAMLVKRLWSERCAVSG